MIGLTEAEKYVECRALTQKDTGNMFGVVIRTILLVNKESGGGCCSIV